MKNTDTIKTMVKEERPYEKCATFGASNLTDIELLSVLLRTGTRGESCMELARKLLYPVFAKEGILNIHQWTYEQLVGLRGIGTVKAIQILCLSELAKRLSKAVAHSGLNFTTPAAIAKYYMEDMRHAKQENMKLLLLNTKACLIGECNVSKGTVNATVVSPRELFVEALQKNAVFIILLHNHPSGDVTPSKEDLLITKRISDAGRLIGIELLDHIIIGNNCYASLREKGFIQE